MAKKAVRRVQIIAGELSVAFRRFMALGKEAGA
jgi:hypothetical protein